MSRDIFKAQANWALNNSSLYRLYGWVWVVNEMEATEILESETNTSSNAELPNHWVVGLPDWTYNGHFPFSPVFLADMTMLFVCPGGKWLESTNLSNC